MLEKQSRSHLSLSLSLPSQETSCRHIVSSIQDFSPHDKSVESEVAPTSAHGRLGEFYIYKKVSLHASNYRIRYLYPGQTKFIKKLCFGIYVAIIFLSGGSPRVYHKIIYIKKIYFIIFFHERIREISEDMIIWCLLYLLEIH